jgi:hypothetical protein
MVGVRAEPRRRTHLTAANHNSIVPALTESLSTRSESAVRAIARRPPEGANMIRRSILLAGFCLAAGCLQPQTRLQSADESERADSSGPDVKTIGDISQMSGVEAVPIAGIGLVTRLEGTGGGVPPGPERVSLEEVLKKRGVENIKELFNSKTTSIVHVSAYVPAGIHKGDPIDVYVTIPETSRTTSLRGGVLEECLLYNYASSNAISAAAGNQVSGRSDATIRGHAWVRAEGPILAGIRPDSDPDDPPSTKSGVIWGGGKNLMPDSMFTLYLNADQQYARVASQIAERINETFHAPGAVGGGTGEVAHAVSKSSVTLTVPGAYRLNIARFLRVVRLTPLDESPGPDSAYSRKLVKQLLDPATTISAALRLEALGSQSISPLKVGLHSEIPLVRFAAAESLAYLGSPSCGEELGKQVAEQPFVQAFALTALASLNEAVCRVKLEELLSAPSPETRYGAFRALRARDERDSLVQGENIGGYWLHQVARSSSPQIHYSTSKRAEIVLFGDAPTFVAPFSLLAGDFVVRAKEGESTCTITRMTVRKGKQIKTSPLDVADVLRAMAELGGNYSDSVELLRQAESTRGLNCAVKVDALPKAPTVYDLARAGVELSGGKSSGLATMSAEIGVTPTLYEKLAAPKSTGE